MKRIITPSVFLSAQLAAASAAPVCEDTPRDDDEKPSHDEHAPIVAWLALHTVGRGVVVLH